MPPCISKVVHSTNMTTMFSLQRRPCMTRTLTQGGGMRGRNCILVGLREVTWSVFGAGSGTIHHSQPCGVLKFGVQGSGCRVDKSQMRGNLREVTWLRV